MNNLERMKKIMFTLLYQLKIIRDRTLHGNNEIKLFQRTGMPLINELFCCQCVLQSAFHDKKLQREQLEEPNDTKFLFLQVFLPGALLEFM